MLRKWEIDISKVPLSNKGIGKGGLTFFCHTDLAHADAGIMSPSPCTTYLAYWRPIDVDRCSKQNGKLL